MPIKDPVLRKAYRKEYNIKNREKIRAYKLANKEVIAAYNKTWREENKEKVKTDLKVYRQENKEKIKLKTKEWRSKNRDRIKKRRASRPPEKRNPEWNKRYIEKHPGRKALKNLRERMRLALKGVYKSGKSFELIGCDYEFFVKHIERQFKPGMTWDNYGNGGWVIDHIVPCAVFDLTKDYQQKACFNWQNLQPLWEWENLAKGDKVEVCPV